MKNYILQNENAIYYECGFSCDNVIFISLDQDRYFITDGRYELDAKEKCKTCEIIITRDLVKIARNIIKKSKIKKIYFDPNDFSYETYTLLSKNLHITFSPKPNFSKQKRIIKEARELELIQKAMELGRGGFKKFQDYLLSDGIFKSEQYLAFKARTFLSDNGKFDLSFEPIIAINGNSAKPHATPTDKIYNLYDLLLFDGGIKYERYCSDRTVTFGDDFSSLDEFQRGQIFKNKERQKVYDIVLKAQQTAISKAKIGMRASELDKVGRDIIDEAGYGKYFVHSTGHGVGLDIHEYPNISSKSDVVLEENMVFTIEPGIYLPNDFGVRIEDTIVLKNDGAVIL